MSNNQESDEVLKIVKTTNTSSKNAQPTLSPHGRDGAEFAGNILKLLKNPLILIPLVFALVFGLYGIYDSVTDKLDYMEKKIESYGSEIADIRKEWNNEKNSINFNRQFIDFYRENQVNYIRKDIELESRIKKIEENQNNIK